MTMAIGEGWDLPPGSEPWSDFHWFTVSTRQDLEIVLLSSVPVWYTGHFLGGRMCPCLGTGCEYCGAAIGAQVRYCFGCAEVYQRRVGLIEMGRSNGLLLQEWSRRAGGLRGMSVRLSKHSKSSQSRTEMTYLDIEAPGWVLGVKPPDASLALYLTWHKAGFEMPSEFKQHMQGFFHSRRGPTG